MGKILNIETTSTCCSVSIGIDGELKSICETIEPRSHSRKINFFVEKVLKDAGLKNYQEFR